ncbi:unnamed protein product, partial [Phaeothamnion confervicola]
AIQVLVVVTDGKENQGSQPLAVAKAARAAGMEVFAVGVSSSVDMDELVAISGGNAVHWVQSFMDLDSTLADSI